MIRKREIITLTVLLAAHCSVAPGQSPPATVLTIDCVNFVEYRQDISDLTKYATDPNLTTAITPRNFFTATMFADIVAVNGQPAKGLYVGRPRTVLAFPTPVPGQAVADTTRNSFRDVFFEIQKSDGTPIGSIAATGLSGGASPPGAPLAQQGSNFAIIGGTGAFLGARGQAGSGTGNSPRAASFSEDPANRRINGGGKAQFILQVIPTAVPQIVATANGPAVVHSSDFSLVTSSKPAAAGELLSLFATGLGPVTPGVNPGQPFPSSPLAAVNSPVDVTVNGKAADILAAVGYPGAADGYQVNFRVPSDTAKGVATIQVSAAWIAGTPVTIAVQ
jgi:uncharacterized protein (TIGR03437 family)